MPTKPTKQIAAEILDYLRNGVASGARTTRHLLSDAPRHAAALEALLRKKSRAAEIALAGGLLSTVGAIGFALGEPHSLTASVATVAGLALSFLGFVRSR